MHPRIAERIVKSAELPKDATVLEIGPGRGILTKALLARAKKVIAVEMDAALVAELKETFAKEIAGGRLELVHADIRDWVGHNLNSRYSVKDGYHVIANIPYYLTGEIIRMFLEARNQPRSMMLLVQKEVAERVARSGKPYSAKASKGKESLLSLSVKAYGTPRYEFTVPRGAFRPAPKVDSAVLAIRDISRRNFKNAKEEKHFFELLHAGFAHKRKLVRNNLIRASVISAKALQAAGIPESARAEDLPLETWLSAGRAEFR